MNRPRSELRFKLNENMPREAISLIAAAGYKVFSVFDEHLEGMDDSRVISVSKQEGLALITCDLHFSDIRTYPPVEYHGIIVLRPRRQGRPSILKLIADLIPQFDRTKLL